jgi:hypothetical protein
LELEQEQEDWHRLAPRLVERSVPVWLQSLWNPQDSARVSHFLRTGLKLRQAGPQAQRVP